MDLVPLLLLAAVLALLACFVLWVRLALLALGMLAWGVILVGWTLVGAFVLFHLGIGRGFALALPVLVALLVLVWWGYVVAAGGLWRRLRRLDAAGRSAPRGALAADAAEPRMGAGP